MLRILMVLCALNMLFAQLLGLHFHRHVIDGPTDHGTSLHLRDAGLHLHEDAADHHAAGDRASHPDEDVEIDPLGTGLAKFSKVWLGAAVLFLVAFALLIVVPASTFRVPPFIPRRMALFALRPPSNAPPPEPSPA
jgi:hypothetical protein